MALSSVTGPLSPELLKDKSKITVVFQASTGGRTAGVSSVRVTEPKVED